MIMDEPFSAAPKKNIITEIKDILPPPSSLEPPQRVRVNVETVEIIIPRMKTGDLMAKISVDKPIRMFPQMAPTPKRLKILAD
jgi:hypothetical protein